ncbi:hypothetical protein B0H10DRAFT_2185805 [Mycena sp. CBHHK59/15]|nr:hypothetical protein B0H10DRAFT_2185805 [Mycena sp. CBHHK59/15]
MSAINSSLCALSVLVSCFGAESTGRASSSESSAGTQRVGKKSLVSLSSPSSFWLLASVRNTVEQAIKRERRALRQESYSQTYSMNAGGACRRPPKSPSLDATNTKIIEYKLSDVRLAGMLPNLVIIHFTGFCKRKLNGWSPTWMHIDNWQRAPPNSQFQTYGPPAGYFHEKFPPTFFLIKPQAYLSAASNQPPGGHRRIDFHGMEVNGSRTYPDLTICQFFGADADGTSPDVIRVVYKIGTMPTRSEKDRVARQLGAYLETVTRDRFDTNLLGVAQIQNEVYLIKNTPNTESFHAVYPHWISFFDPLFVNELNVIRSFSYTRDAALR